MLCFLFAPKRQRMASYRMAIFLQAVTLMNACGPSQQVTSAWTSPGYQPGQRFERVFITSFVSNHGMRVQLENAMAAKKFAALGVIFVAPGQHPAYQVFDLIKSHGLQHHTGLATSVATAAVEDHLFVFQLLQLVDFCLHNAAQRMQETPDVEVGMLVWLPNIYQAY